MAELVGEQIGLTYIKGAVKKLLSKIKSVVKYSQGVVQDSKLVVQDPMGVKLVPNDVGLFTKCLFFPVQIKIVETDFLVPFPVPFPVPAAKRTSGNPQYNIIKHFCFRGKKTR